MVEEAENTPVQQAAYVNASSRDTVRSRSFTGKPARMLRNDWTEAWEKEENPKPLGMPLQYMVSGMAVAATHKHPDESIDVAFNPVGQVVGQFEKVEKTAAVAVLNASGVSGAGSAFGEAVEGDERQRREADPEGVDLDAADDGAVARTEAEADGLLRFFGWCPQGADGAIRELRSAGSLENTATYS